MLTDIEESNKKNEVWSNERHCGELHYTLITHTDTFSPIDIIYLRFEILPFVQIVREKM